MSDLIASPDANIETVPFTDALSERYLAYALSTITSRSLPDVRDGLKPVHRRLLYAMLQLKLSPTEGFKKCARVVGDVIGKYHPHGDGAVYDAMVRLAQTFSVRYRIVDGQGNFGSIDGDNAAAMRYTEARLTAYALALAEDLDMDTVDFRPNYDGTEHEPAVMPAGVPNLLANGAEGIAVGMATSIPPHNVGELCAAMLHLLANPEATERELMAFVPAPDFPTGGILIEPQENILKAYETGKGSFRLRAKWEKEDLGRGLYRIVITEIPYLVQKSRLIERIADLMKQKKIAALGDARDESAEDIRIVLEPKSRQIPAEALMESLFKLTDLETRISLNMNVLNADNVPGVMSLGGVLRAYLAHRREVLLRKSRFRLAKIADRLEVLEGLLIAYLNLDEVIRIIREEDHPKQIMMRKWNLTERQVEAILNMRLRSLRKLEEIEIRNEHDALSKEQAALEALVGSEKKQTKALTKQIEHTAAVFGDEKHPEGPRRTEIGQAPDALPEIGIEVMVEKEPLTVICSAQGWIRAFKGHHYDPSQVKYKDGDEGRYVFNSYTTEKLLIFSPEGKFYALPCANLSGGKGSGDPLHMLFDMPAGAEPVNVFPFVPGQYLLVASAGGKGFRVKADDTLAQTKSGKQVLNPAEGDSAKICLPLTADRLAFIGDNRKVLILQPEDIPEMKRGRGVQLQKHKAGGLAEVWNFAAEEGMSWQTGSRTRRVTDFAPWEGKRGSTGKTAPMGFPRTFSLFG